MCVCAAGQGVQCLFFLQPSPMLKEPETTSGGGPLCHDVQCSSVDGRSRSSWLCQVTFQYRLLAGGEVPYPLEKQS